MTTTTEAMYFLTLHTEDENGSPNLSPEDTVIYYGPAEGIVRASKEQTGFNPEHLFDGASHDVRHGKWVINVSPCEAV